MRKDMIDEDQLFDALYYERKDKKLSDIPNYFKFSYYENKGKKAEDTFVIPNRRNTAESVTIETDSEINFKPDDVIVIDGLSYNITSIPPVRNSSYDLKVLRGGSNVTKVMILDK